MPPLPSNSPCVVIFSGGQDSTTSLFWARKNFAEVYALSFDYGQRHRRELACAEKICKHYDINWTLLPINTFGALGGNSLVDSSIAVQETGASGLPNSFVPGRNLIFITFAAAWAWSRGIKDLVVGVCEADFSGYPDCRQNTMQSLQQSLCLGMDSPFFLHAPLMHLSKADSVLLARDLGALEALAMSHTCYLGLYPPCGDCPACKLRARGFAKAAIADPLLEQWEQKGFA